MFSQVSVCHSAPTGGVSLVPCPFQGIGSSGARILPGGHMSSGVWVCLGVEVGYVWGWILGMSMPGGGYVQGGGYPATDT